MNRSVVGEPRDLQRRTNQALLTLCIITGLTYTVGTYLWLRAHP